MENSTEKLLTIQEAAILLNVNVNKLRRWANKGWIAAVCSLDEKKRPRMFIMQKTIDAILATSSIEYPEEWL